VSCGLCLILLSKCWEKSVGETYECYELECLCHQLLCGEFGANGIPTHLKDVNIKLLFLRTLYEWKATNCFSFSVILDFF
jgi:hypothetical protein